MTGTAEGVPAVVRLAGERDLAATLAAVDDRTLTVVLPVAAPRAYRDDRAVVEYATTRGVHRVHGLVRTDPACAEVLNVARHGGEILQRREWARVDAVRAVRLMAGGQLSHGYTRNLSAGGMLVQGPLPLAVGEEVAFALQLVDGEAPLEGHGPVTDVREDVVAVRLEAIAGADRERIVRWATERQRHELRTVRRR